ncbi:MAG: hypothetical protein ACFB00_11815 [Parvularculaceae bacterium]
MDATIPSPQTSNPFAQQIANERLADLSARRPAPPEGEAAAADEARARSAETLAATREAIARALGANTRLAISPNENAPGFIYRAIDVDTGEVVQEWPEAQFVDAVRTARADVEAERAGGVPANAPSADSAPETGAVLDDLA